MKIEYKMRSFSVVLCSILIQMVVMSGALGQYHAAGPQPGDVYKEFYISNNGERWRVTDPNAGNPGAAQFLPNPVITFNINDFVNVIKAEVVLDVWGGHVGTTDKRVRFNGNQWIDIQELVTTPANGQCYAQQVNYLLDIPVSDLRAGNNTLEATSGGQTCYNFNWGQWGLYGAVVRLYYDSSKPHTTGQITSQVNGDVISENPTISVAVSGGVSKIEVLARYEGYDIDGDGFYYDWARSYHRQSETLPIQINGHVGTITGAPYSITWDTEWVPDQNDKGISLVARIRDTNGYYYVTDIVDELTLSRPDRSVKLFKPRNVPQNFWVRDGDIESSDVVIDSVTLANALAAKLFVATWNGNDNTNLFSVKVNGLTLPKFGNDHYYSLDTVNVPLSGLIESNNTIEFTSTTSDHGIEVMWPGPAIMIAGANIPSAPVITQQPDNISVFEGESATFSIWAAGSLPMSYQWKKNGVDIPGANSRTFTIPSVDASNDGEIYSVEVSNANGSVLSNNARLILSQKVLDIPFAGNTDDTSGQGNHGNPSTLSQFTSDLFGNTDQAGLFDGNYHLEVPHTASLAVENVTVAAWIWVDQYRDDQRIISKEFQSSPWSSYTLLLSGQQERYLEFRIAVNNQRYVTTSPTTIPLDQWVHVAGTFDGKRMKLFIDGVLISMVEVNGTISQNSNPVYIGNSQFYDRQFHGKIDEVKIYKGALNEEQIQLLAYNDLSLKSIPESAFDLDITNTAVLPGDIQLKWADPSEEDGFLIEKQTNGGGFIEIGATGADVLQFTDSDIANGNSYNYRVISFSSMGLAAPSNVVSFSVNDPTDQTPPVIQNISLSTAQDTAVISWTTAEATFGTINFGPSTAYNQSADDDLKMDHEVVLRNLDPGTSYFYQIVSTDGSGNTAQTGDLNFSLDTLFTVTSDDFQAYVLDNSLWEFENPLGDATVTMTGTQASISVPGGTSHSLWTNGNNTARIVQQISNLDFEVEMKVESELVMDQFYGFLVKASETEFIRFDVAHNNPRRLFAAHINGGFSQINLNTNVTLSTPTWLRLGRVGDTWTFSYSEDGQTWTVATSFDQAMVVDEVGLFVGNSGSNPAHTALIDYFFNTDSPIDPEDNELPDEIPPVISDVEVSPSAGGAVVSWTTDEPSTSRVDYGLSSAYSDYVEDLTLKTVHSVSITGLAQETTYHYQITSADGRGNTTTGSDTTFTTLTDDTPPVISNIVATPSGNSVVITWTTDEPATGHIDYGLSAAYTDFEQDSVLKTNHSIELINLDSETEYHYQVTSTDEVGNVSSSVDLTFTTNAFDGVVSDDFSAPGLNTTLWEFENPLGDATVTMNGTQASISVPGGTSHSLWTNGNNTARIVQQISNLDFEVEMKVESELVRDQFYGFLVKASETHFMRFDIAHNNPRRLFAAYINGGSSQIRLNTNVTLSTPTWLRLGRVGDTWTFSYSEDGQTWTVATSFDQAMVVDEVGLFVGNSGSNPAHTALIDYFFNTDSPIDPEDNELPDEIPPVISDVEVSPSAGGAVVSWTTDEPSTSRVDYGLSSAYSDYVEDLTLKTVHSVSITGLAQETTYHYQITSADGRGNTTTGSDTTFTTLTDDTPPVISNIVATPSGNSVVITWTTDEPAAGHIDYGLSAAYTDFEQDSVLKTNHSIELINLDSETEYHYQVTSTDEVGNVSSSVDLTFTTNAFDGVVSDDFSAPGLNTTLWEFENPLGDATVTMNGTQASISVPGGTSHSLWTNGNNTARIVQQISNLDFEVEMKVESELVRDQFYGFLVKASETHFMRFDIAHNNPRRLFAAYINGGSSQIRLNTNVTLSTPKWLRLGRVGDTWTFSYSEDGQTWTVATSFDQAMVVDEVGLFVGNSGSNPAHTALIDYFFNTASPIDPEDNELPDEIPPVISDVEVTPSAGGAVVSWTTDEPSTSRVDYGLSSAYSDYVEDLTLKTVHSVSITGLAQETTYHYQITSADGRGNTTTGSDTTFTTLTDDTPPVISNIVATPSGNSVVITWTTDEPAAGLIDYGLSAAYTDFEQDSVLKTNHSIELINLDSETEYHYQVTSTDEVGNVSSSVDLTFTTNAFDGVVSDDFSAPGLNTTLWEFENPLGDATVTMNGTQASISVPGGTSHSLWTNGNNTARIVQQISNLDFEVEMKVESELVRDQFYGFLVKASETHFIRFDVAHGNPRRLFAAHVNGNTSQIRLNTNTTLSTPIWLRLGRVGDTWTFSYSNDGENWAVAVAFNYAIVVDEVGLFVGNSGTNPAHTALIDYFFNTASPIDPEGDADEPAPSGRYVAEGDQWINDENSALNTVSSTSLGLDGSGELRISSAYPNPFNEVIQFTIAGYRDPLQIHVFDHSGKHIETLFDGYLKSAEEHTIQFNGRSSPPGVYFIQVRGKDFIKNVRVLLTK